jgi:hypothetical protein
MTNPKCPKCGGEGWLDVSGKHQCVKCGHYFRVEVDPLSSPFEDNPRCRICGVPVSDHDFAIYKGYIGKHRPVMAEMNPNDPMAGHESPYLTVRRFTNIELMRERKRILEHKSRGRLGPMMTELLDAVESEIEQRQIEMNPLTYDDYKEAIEGEGWAIGDYLDMLGKADTPEERTTIRHIRKEEQEHLDELIDLMELKKFKTEKNPPMRYESNISRYYPTKEDAEKFIEEIKAKGWVIAHFELTDHPLYGHKWWVDYRLPQEPRYQQNRYVSPKRRKILRKKIPQIQAGRGTRPPKEWFNSMRKIVKKGYPGRGRQEVDRITAGIWHSYSPQAKIGIVRRLSAGTGGIPR